MHAEDIARSQLWDSIARSIDADVRLCAMTDAEIADLLLQIYGQKESFSLEETVLSNVRERLQRTSGGMLYREE